MNLKTPILVLVAVTLMLAVAGTAAAHKTAYSPDGKIRIVWGFLNEPAVTMTKNGLDIRIADNATNYNISDLQSAIHVEMHKGAHEIEFKDLTGQFNKPGYYTAVITPTEPGVYTLHISGTVNGTQLDMEIDAAHEIEDIADTYFPKLAASDVSALEGRVKALEDKAKTQSETPATVTKEATKPAPGFAPALVLGAAGLVTLALALRRRS